VNRFKHYFPDFPDFPVDDGSPLVLEGSEPRVDSLGPYLAALAFGIVATILALLMTDVPAAPLVGIGASFGILAALTRRLRELPRDPDNPMARRLTRLCRALDEQWGLEFYGLASIATFLWLESGSLLNLQFADTLGNAVQAAIWWYPMWTHVGEPFGAVTCVSLVAAAWTFWFVLGVHPEQEPWLH